LDLRRNHLLWDAVDGGGAFRLVKTGLCDAANTDTAVDGDSGSFTSRHFGINKRAVRDIRVVARVLSDGAAGFDAICTDLEDRNLTVSPFGVTERKLYLVLCGQDIVTAALAAKAQQPVVKPQRSFGDPFVL
jgi:hypothetical protein